VQGRLRKERLQVEIATCCAHCGRAMHLVVDENFRWRIRERGADPRLYLPHIDWAKFRGQNITHDF